MECLKREKCVKVLDRACKQTEFFLCSSDELENDSETGWCMYQKSGINHLHQTTVLFSYIVTIERDQFIDTSHHFISYARLGVAS